MGIKMEVWGNSYMMAAIESHQNIGGDELYLDPLTFRRDHHDEIIGKIMDEALVGTKIVPARDQCVPTLSTSEVTYRGARLVDGKCKPMAKPEDESVSSTSFSRPVCLQRHSLINVDNKLPGFSHHSKTLVGER